MLGKNIEKNHVEKGIFRKDFGFGNLFLTPIRVGLHDMTNPYYMDRACFLVPASKVRKDEILNFILISSLILSKFLITLLW